MSTEYQKYRLSDYTRATLIAPLASIPAVILVLLLFALYSSVRNASDVSGVKSFIRQALFFIGVTLPTAYISTAIFGALGVVEANFAKSNPTVPVGAVIGLVCGGIVGVAWIYFLTSDLTVIFSGFYGTFIFPISLLSGFGVGAVFTIIANRRTISERGI